MLSTIKHNLYPDPIAVIDIGTNTLRLLIGLINADGLVRIASVREVTRLGKNLTQTHLLDHTNAELSIRTLAKFKAECDEYNVRRIVAVGTSALREAEDSDYFLKRVKEVTGMDISIMSGDKEAEMKLKGIRCRKDFLNAPCLAVIDSGGGSTEMILCHDRFTKASFPIGAVKMFELFIINDPPTASEIKELKAYLIGEFKSALSSLPEQMLSSRCPLVATGGTSATLASIHLKLISYEGENVHGHSISYTAIASMLEHLISMPLKMRYTISGLEKERADIIIAGTVILMTLMELLCKENLIVSDYGLMEGLLLEATERA